MVYNYVILQYWYELYLDDLPMWGMVGEVLRDEKTGEREHHIFTHRSLSLTFNGNRIIEANLTAENPVSVLPGAALDHGRTHGSKRAGGSITRATC